MGTTTTEMTLARDASKSPEVPTKREYPGALVVVEGIDGSGKSTQLYLLKRWLEIHGYRIHFTEWNSSPLVKSATRRGPRLLASLAAQFIQLRAGAGRHLLLPRPARRCRKPHRRRSPQVEILRS